MARSFCRASLAIAFLASCLSSCTKPMTTKDVKPPPPDPLLMSKKPITGRPDGADYDRTTQFEPTPPAPPAQPMVPASQSAALRY
jgi:hypothetical protein